MGSHWKHYVWGVWRRGVLSPLWKVSLLRWFSTSITWVSHKEDKSTICWPGACETLTNIDLWNINDSRYAIHHPCIYIIYPHCHFTSHLYYILSYSLFISKLFMFLYALDISIHPSIHLSVPPNIYIYNIPYHRSCMGKKRSYCLVSVDIPSLRTMDNQMATLPTSWSATAHFHLFALLSCSRNHWKMGGGMIPLVSLMLSSMQFLDNLLHFCSLNQILFDKQTCAFDMHETSWTNCCFAASQYLPCD